MINNEFQPVKVISFYHTFMFIKIRVPFSILLLNSHWPFQFHSIDDELDYAPISSDKNSLRNCFSLFVSFVDGRAIIKGSNRVTAKKVRI